MTDTKSPPKASKNRKAAPQETVPGTWSESIPLTVRAMVLTSDKLVIAGPPDLARKDTRFLAYKNEAETLAAFRGQKGVFIKVVSASDGKILSEAKLDAMPVFDGLSAAGGKVYLSLKDGTVQCWGP